MVVVVFRSRERPGTEAELLRLGGRLYELAVAQPGFLSYKDFLAEDGESVAIVEFESLAHVDAWREHPEHREAQVRGRAELFKEYTIHVCEVVRTRRFAREEAAA